MKPALIALSLVVFLVHLGSAQPQQFAEVEMPGFKFLRSDEDYSFLADHPEQTGLWNRIKYLSLGRNSGVSLGGDVRTEFQVLYNEDWREGNNDAALFQRFMLHSDWRLGDHVRVFGQLKNGFTIGRNGPKLFLNEEELDLHQLFLGLQFGSSTIEIGRREIRYGSRRLISVREGTNVRQSFDGVRWIWKKGNHQFDALLYAYNQQRIGFFDNSITTDQLLWGGYWVWNNLRGKDLKLDLYYLGVRNRAPSFDAGMAEETRHSFGVRHWGNIGRWSYNNEAVFQTGSFGDGNIQAWTISTDTYFLLPGKGKPTLGLKAQVISGDDNPDDDKLQTFNPLYPRGGYFGLLALIGPANIFDVHPSFKISFGTKWQLDLDWDFFWRHQLGDGIYFPSGRLNVSGRNTSQRFIGHQPGIQLGYVLSRFVEVGASYFLFVAGDFIAEVSDGRNFSQLGTSINVKF